MWNYLGACKLEMNGHEHHLLLNMDKKKIMEPGKLTFSGGSSFIDLALVHPEMGNPFQYELFQLLGEEWRGDHCTLIQDTEEVRDFLLHEEGYEYYEEYRYMVSRIVRKEGEVTIVSLHPTETHRLKKNWKKFINQYVLINYDSHLFMTIDRRLFRRTKNLMPYFFLAQVENSESNSSWAGHRIGIEPLDTATFDSLDYFEMFRMVGDKSACQLGVEDYERRNGPRS